MKRAFDLLLSSVGILLTIPFLLPVILAIFLYDFHFPLYIPMRVGKGGKKFRMFKLRSMTVNADKTGVASTSNNDKRITPIGKLVRACKLDEFVQLWNVFLGDMSFVGPRPQIETEVAVYTEVEMGLLKVRPGITDFSSIVFSDEGDILSVTDDPDVGYNQLIRPWKSRLGLFYIEKQSLMLDIELIALTVLAVASKKTALKILTKILSNLKADPQVIEITKRQVPLAPFPPPGSNEIFTAYA